MLTKTRAKVAVRVEAATNPGETVCVCGSSVQLGQWDASKSMQLMPEDPNCEIWTGFLEVSDNNPVEYRYFIAIVLESPAIAVSPQIYDIDSPPGFQFKKPPAPKDIIVRRWESHLRPRKINPADPTFQETTVDVFGVIRGEEKVEAGWLTAETVVQLKFCNNPITLWKRRFKDRSITYKVSPIDLARKDSEAAMIPYEEDQESTNVTDYVKNWPVIEISAMNSDELTFVQQEQFGHVNKPDEYVILRAQMISPEKTAYMVDFYLMESNGTSIPEHIGFCYILPSNLRENSGSCTMPITGNKHQPIGQLTIEYLVIRPPKGYTCDCKVTYARHWKPMKPGLDVGHRGAGNARRTDKVENVLENTVASFNYAANHGADMVELDVQLSKDLVPVIYHDYYINISMKKKKTQTEHEMLKICVKDLTHQQLQMLKLSPVHNPKKQSYDFLDDDPQDNQPFPTLKHVLEAVDPHVGFNVEIKCPMRRIDGTWDAEIPCDYNAYVDIILKDLLENAGNRYIMLSCFCPDICTMLRLKQNKYPLLFLTQGQTEKYLAYLDPRTSSIPMASYFAKAMGFLGINVHAEDLLKDKNLITFVRSRGLVLFCWGEDLNDKDVIQEFKRSQVDGVIYDKIDEFSPKHDQLFVAESRDTRLALLEVVTGQKEEDLYSWNSSVSGVSNSNKSASP